MNLERRRLSSPMFVSGVLAAVFVLMGCGNPKIVIQAPLNNTSVACGGAPPMCPVSVVTKWTGAILTAPTLSLDGVLVTNALASDGTGKVSAPPGQHTIVVNGTIVINNGTSNVTDTSTFTITPPPNTLILTPASGITVQAGGTAGNIKVTTSEPLTSPLSVTLTSSSATVAKLGSPPAASQVVMLPAATTSMPTSVQESVSGLSAGLSTISATTSGIQSSPTSSLKVTVSAAPPPPPKAAVFRGSGTDVQSFAFSSTNTWAPVDTQAATVSPGNFVVGVALAGTGTLLRTSASDIQVFTINSDLTLTTGSTIGASVSGTGASVASSGTNVIRASNSGIQVFTLTGTTLVLAGTKNAGLSPTGTGVDTAGTVAVRVYSSGIEVFNVATPTAPVLFGSNLNNAQSSTAPSVKIFAGGTRAIRAHDSGIEIYDITAAGVPKLGGASGGLSSSGTAVAVNATGTQAVRVYSGGIEVYSLASQTNPTKVASLTTVSLSSTGVGVCIKGTNAFRATDSVVEAFDISAAATGTITALGQTGATLSSTGVGFTCR